MKILEEKIIDPPIYAGKHDTITLLYDDQPIAVRAISKSAVYDKAIIFELEPGDFLGDAGIGGVFVERI
jgi:hypothetical protein